ncbi:glycosyltransferase family 4 protein [Pseudooceanicola sp.]|uniref:glycosyltransferase family 4 protein n=1 Tax=Pseudooceanicola sp. TaxID=1914328 RepID=UPI003516287D
MSAIPQPTAFRHSPVSMAPVSSAAERADEQGQRNAPRFRLRVYPTVSRNPYLGLLYGAFEGAEVEMLERVRLMRRFGFMGRADVLHFHWEDGSFWGVKSPWTVRHRLKIVLRMLNRHRAGGGKIVWTVHNEAPHRPGEDHEGFRALRAWLVAHADMVHVHSEAAARMLIESWKADPAKIEVIAHPSYLGVYPQTPGSPPAKVAGKAAFLFFGVYSAYKGGDALRRVFAAPGAEGFVQSLTVAGATPDDEAVRLRDAFAGAEMPVHLRLDRVPDEDVPGLFRGAHACVLPYRRTMTSGVANLALTYGVPVVAPDMGGIAEGLPESARALLYDPDDPNGLARAAERAAALDQTAWSRISADCRALAADRAPFRQSQRLLAAMTRRGIV